MAVNTATKTGKVVQVVGVVLDVEFSAENLPKLYDALLVKREKHPDVYLEVAQHLSETSVRAIALSSTDGIKRGELVEATGAPISVPIGDETLGRMFNVVGEAIDKKPQPKVKVTFTD
jgi:F-type H+-transporting ATPase subunit beta